MYSTKLHAPNSFLMTFVMALALLIGGAHMAHADDADVRSIAFVGFRLINSSIETPSQAEFDRLKLLNRQIAEKLTSSGRYKVIPVPEEMLQDIAKGQDFGECECEADYGKKLNAQLIGWGTVEKVSNLILNINVYIADVATNKFVFVKSVDIRGNDDTSWTRGLRWLLRYYLKDVK